MRSKRLLSLILVIAVVLGAFTVNVSGASATGLQYEVSVAVDPDNKSVDLSTFETDLKNAMVSRFNVKYPSNAITASAITINYIKPNNVTTSDQSAWKIYDHYYSPTYSAITVPTEQDKANLLALAGRAGQPFYYYKEGSGNPTGYFTTPTEGIDSVHYRDKHIYTAGSRATFLGYSVPAYKDFMLYPDSSNGSKTLTYSIYLSSVGPHTLSGAGYLINAGITGTGSSAVINGYLLYYAYSGTTSITGENLNLYKLTNVNVDALHENNTLTSVTGVSAVANNITPAVSGVTKSVKDIKIEVSSSKVIFYEKDGTTAGSSYIQALSQNLTSTGQFGYGPFVAYAGHGCSQLTVYTYDNLTMTSNVTKTFSDKVLETQWHDGAVHALVDVNDSGIVNYNDDNARTETLQRLIDSNVSYIGWGKGNNTATGTSITVKDEALSFINDNNENGIYIDTSTSPAGITRGDGTTSSASGYNAQVQEIAAYLVDLVDLNPNLAPVAHISYVNDVLSSTSTDPNGDALTENWSVKEADEASWTTTTSAAIATSTLAAKLGAAGAGKNVLVQLTVSDGVNVSEPDVLYLSTLDTVKPLARFTIRETIDLEALSGTTIAAANMSYDPRVPARSDMTYDWKVYNEMNRVVLASSEVNPIFEFAGLPAGDYEVRLTAAVSSGAIKSNSFVQTVKIIDTVAPKLLAGVTGNKNSAVATIEIIDYGSGPDSYRAITTDTGNTTITGPWLPAVAARSIVKTYSFNPSTLKALSFEVKDGSGNTSIYPVDFGVPNIAFSPNGGNIYTNFTYDEDVKVTISSLSNATITDWYYEWKDSSTYPADGDITLTGTHVTTTTSAIIAQPMTIGSYYLHVMAINSSNTSKSAVSEMFQVSVAQNGIHDLRISSISGNNFSFAWKQPDNATAQKLMYSTNNGSTWSQASTQTLLAGSSSSAVVTGLNASNTYRFKLKVDGGADAGDSNIVFYQKLLSYTSPDTTASVTKNLLLVKTLTGSSITWASSNPSVADANGNVFRPPFAQGDQTVTLTATVNQAGASYSIPYTFSVTKLPATDDEAVAADKESLGITYAAGDSAANVTQNVTLPAIATQGSTVTWASDDIGTISASGAVTRPANGQGDKKVVMTATIARGSVSNTKRFTLIVKQQTLSDLSIVASDKAALEIGYQPGDSASYVTRDITLPATASNGSTVTWAVSSGTAISTAGVVTRPLMGTSDASVTFVATISKGSASDTKTFDLTVIAVPVDDAAALEMDMATLDIIYSPGDSSASVTQNVTLITLLPNGSTVNWNSDNTAVTTTGAVTRPSGGSGDITVNLQADVLKSTTSAAKTFVLTVKQQSLEGAAVVAADADALAIGYASGDNAASVTKNVTLPTVGSSGSSITWSSDVPLTIDILGNVYRPNGISGDKTVVLTAGISKDGASTTRAFTLKVIALPADDQHAVAYDKNRLDIVYAEGDSAASVTQNVTLPLTMPNGSSINWASDASSSITTAGNVTRPGSDGEDKVVTLTATITKNGTSDTKTFLLTVKKILVTDEDIVAADKNALAIEYALGDSASSVTRNVTLPAITSNGSTVTWASDHMAIANDGTVTRPNSGNNDVTVHLTATIAKNTTTTTKAFTVVVKMTDAAAVAADKAALAILYATGDSAASVTQNVTLSAITANGCTVTWATSTSGAIRTDGVVTRPESGSEDTIVRLTATVSKNSASDTRDFYLTVKLTDEAAVAADKAALTIGYATGNSATDVTNNLTLPTTGDNGTVITWTSNKSDTIAADGTVKRPTGSAVTDMTVTLTATITKGSVQQTRTFTLVVRAIFIGTGEEPVVPKTLPAAAGTGIDVIVNGSKEPMATATLNRENGKEILSVDVNEDSLEKKMDAVLADKKGGNTENVVEVPIDSKSAGSVDVDLNGQIVKKMEDNSFKLNVHIDNVSYILPARELNISSIAKTLNSESNLQDISVKVNVSSISSSLSASFVKNAQTENYEIVVPAVNFEITATSRSNGKSVSVSQFAQYVPREFEIPAGIDPKKITTGVVIDPDGTVRHEPTVITVVNGKYFAKINSLTNSPYSVVWNPVEFSDVKNHWAKTAINDMGSRMVVEGMTDGTYAPDKDITRAEFAAVIVRALGVKSGLGDMKFSDVKNTEWYGGYVKTAAYYKIIEGYGNGKFGPMDKITREQAMTMIARTMKTTGLKVETANSEIGSLLKGFSVKGTVSGWASGDIATCIKSGVITKKDGKMTEVNGNITRAETAVIVRNLLQKSGLIN